MQGTAEEQFQNIVTVAEQEALQDIVEDIIDDLLDDSDGPDVVQTGTQVSITNSESDTSSYNANSPEAPANTLELISASTSSIKVISPQEIQQEPLSQPESQTTQHTTAQVPTGPVLPTLLNPPINPRTNVTTEYDNELFTEDEDDNQIVPPSLNNPGRTQTLSPTPNLVSSVKSAIELTARDLTPQHNKQVCEELVTLIPILYQTTFNTEGFPSLEKYLWETVGTLPHLLLLRLSLDVIFDEFPDISAIQTMVYCMLKCYLSITNQPAVHQFQDIHLTNHDFDRVTGTAFDSISDSI